MPETSNKKLKLPLDEVLEDTQGINFFIQAFAHIYLQEDYKFNNNHPLTVIAAFFGLPSKTAEGESPSFLNLLKNFVGYQKNSSWAVNLVIALFMIPVNTAATPLRFALNVLKLVTEYLPLMLVKITDFVGQAIIGLFYKGEDQQNTNLMRIAKNIGILLLAIVPTLLHLLCKYIYFLGCHFTSPWDLFRATYKRNETNNSGFFRGADERVFLILHMALVYTFLAPLLLKGLSLSVLPYIASHLPSIILAGINTVGTSLSPFFAFMGHIAVTTTNFVSFGLFKTLFATISPAFCGGIFTAALAFMSVGVVDARFKYYRKPVNEPSSDNGNNVNTELPPNIEISNALNYEMNLDIDQIGVELEKYTDKPAQRMQLQTILQGLARKRDYPSSLLNNENPLERNEFISKLGFDIELRFRREDNTREFPIDRKEFNDLLDKALIYPEKKENSPEKTRHLARLPRSSSWSSFEKSDLTFFPEKKVEDKSKITRSMSFCR